MSFSFFFNLYISTFSHYFCFHSCFCDNSAENHAKIFTNFPKPQNNPQLSFQINFLHFCIFEVVFMGRGQRGKLPPPPHNKKYKPRTRGRFRKGFKIPMTEEVTDWQTDGRRVQYLGKFFKMALKLWGKFFKIQTVYFLRHSKKRP